MRRQVLVILLVAAAACSPTTQSAPSQDAVVSASPATSASPTPSATPPALESIEDLVLGSTAVEAPWPSLFSAVTAGSLWLPNGSEGGPPVLNRLDLETLAVTATIDLGGTTDVFPPDAWAAAPSADGVWVALAYQRAAVLIDPATNTISKRVEMDAVPYGLAEYGSDLWVIDWENSEVLRYDIATGEERLRVEDIREPTDLAVGELGVWANEHKAGFVVRIDPETGAVLARIDVGGRPGVKFGFGSIWARSDDERTMSRIDPTTNAVIATIDLPGNATGVAIAGSVWVTQTPQRGDCERNSYLTRIDPTTNEADGILDLACAGSIATDGERLWVAAKVDGGPGIVTVAAGPRP